MKKIKPSLYLGSTYITMDYTSRIGATTAGVIPPGAGGVVGFEDYGGISGGSDYHRAQSTSQLARFAPDTLARSVRASWDEPFMSEITPDRPAAVSNVGEDVFGAPTFTGTTRNSMLDLRGEAAYNVASASMAPPEGASDVGWRAYALDNGPSSTGLACGTCATAYSRPATAQRAAIGANTPRSVSQSSSYRTPMSKIRAAFFV